MSKKNKNKQPDVDVVVVGAGFSGLYLLYRLRRMGLSARVLEQADDVGGTWYWNRYPGARCDIQSIDYSYSFDPALETEWQWSEKYARQPEILSYLRFIADKYDLRSGIDFSTTVEQARWDEDTGMWRLRMDHGETISCRFYVMATGCLSAPKAMDIAGIDRFRGEVYYTSRWPHEPVDFTGKRVAVIGTGSSGIQSIPLIAQQAADLTVFQRTPSFSIPAHNGPVPASKKAMIAGRHAEYREQARWSRGGVPSDITGGNARDFTEEEQQDRCEAAWNSGELLGILSVFDDQVTNPAANDIVAEFIRNKIRSIVKDPETAEALCPTSYPFGTKRPCLDSSYYATFNLPHVRLIDLRKTPITTLTETGIDTVKESLEFDAVVFATGFDAMTGAIVAVDIQGQHGLALKDKWSSGPKTYLGLTTAGFPNFFTITGPGSPSVLSNMVVSIEQHVDWICDCLAFMRDQGLARVEPTELAENAWVQHVIDFGALTLFPRANSWYMGANVPGKPRVFLPYVGGVDVYRNVCNEVVDKDYLGLAFDGPGGPRCHNGIIRPLKPDVAIMLDIIAALDNPPLETMTVEEARAFAVETAAQQPPGPAVGEILEGALPGAAGDLSYRLYRPDSKGPHPMVVYFHGGGFVIGNLDTDDAFCRELCVQSGAIIISVNYRHAPEARFPAAVDDGFAAVQWIADNARALGGIPGQLAVSGWSAGANMAAVVCQQARNAGGPALAGQLLVTPAVDCDFSRVSYQDNAEGYVLTTGLMHWFWDHYADPADRKHPRASPLLADDLSGLPPTMVVTCEFDPLRDEGKAYAEALAATGVTVRHLNCRGQIHTSITAAAIVSGAEARAEMANSLRRFFAD